MVEEQIIDVQSGLINAQGELHEILGEWLSHVQTLIEANLLITVIVLAFNLMIFATVYQNHRELKQIKNEVENK